MKFSPVRSDPRPPIRRTGPVELWLFVAAYLAYKGSRWIITGHETIAQANTRAIVELEQSLGIAVEGGLQRLFSGDSVTWLLSHLSVAAQFVVLPLVLAGLYRWSRPVYRVLRNTVLSTWLLAIPIHLLYPVAPPRLAGIGLQDTVSALIPGGLTGRSTTARPPGPTPGARRGRGMTPVRSDEKTVAAALAGVTAMGGHRAILAGGGGARRRVTSTVAT